MSTPDPSALVALETAQTAWAASCQAPASVPEDSRTHQSEVMAAHQGAPSISEQRKTHGVIAPQGGPAGVTG